MYGAQCMLGPFIEPGGWKQLPWCTLLIGKHGTQYGQIRHRSLHGTAHDLGGLLHLEPRCVEEMIAEPMYPGFQRFIHFSHIACVPKGIHCAVDQVETRVRVKWGQRVVTTQCIHHQLSAGWCIHRALPGKVTVVGKRGHPAAGAQAQPRSARLQVPACQYVGFIRPETSPARWPLQELVPVGCNDQGHIGMRLVCQNEQAHAAKLPACKGDRCGDGQAKARRYDEVAVRPSHFQEAQ